MEIARQRNHTGKSEVKIIKLFALLFLLFTACSAAKKPETDIQIDLNENSGTSLPYRIEISEEINDGKTLYIKAHLSVLTDFEDPKALIRLSGLKNGINIQERIYQLKDHLTENQGDLLMEMPSSDITDYQLELLWGKEAADFFAKAAAEQLSKISLEAVKVEKLRICEAEICHYNYKINGSIRNDSEAPINDIVLGLSFQTEEAFNNHKYDFSGEKIIPVPKLELMPGETRSFNLQSDRPAENEDARPYLRIKAD